tara:strand:+ start:188 stop:1585 length:1398 start_codon:yes stop_codon:yes gene_type:complete
MSRPKSSWGDIANFGANVYQARQMNKLASQQAENNALLHMQMENMQRQQMMEEMKKEALKHARNLILEFEDMITNTTRKVQQNPILASIETDALEMAFNDAQSGGLDADFFDEMYDLERYRKVGTGINELKHITSNLTDEQLSIKNNVLSYSMQFDDYERAIELAENLPVVQARHNELSTELSSLQPQWNQFEGNAIVLNGKMAKMEWIMFGILSVICLPILFIMLSSPELLGVAEGSEDEMMFGLGSCFAWICIGGAIFAFYEGRKIVIPDSETLLGESSVDDVEERLALYRSMNEDDLFSDEIEELENELRQINNSNDFDLNFLVPHSGDPFQEYFVLLGFTLGKCKVKMQSMEGEFQELTSSLGEHELGELNSSLQTKREYVEFYTKENLTLNPNVEQTSSVESQINWVLHEGYYYKQFGDGSFDSIPHIRNHDGLIIPYQTPKPPVGQSVDLSNSLADLDF